MTWSSNLPRATGPGAAPRAATPVAWAPDELVLDTRELREAVVRSAPPAPPAPSAPEPPRPDPAEVERATREAYERGLAEGRRAGELDEAARLRGATLAVAEALASVQASADTWVGNAEENICALAIAIARQVIGREVVLDKSALAEMVRQALGEFPLDQPITLRVHPADVQAIHSAFLDAGDRSPLEARKDVQWLPDPRIAPGGCLIEGRDRIVDGRVDTALERLYRRLTYTGA